MTWAEKRAKTKKIEVRHTRRLARAPTPTTHSTGFGTHVQAHRVRQIIKAGASPAGSRKSLSARRHPHLVNLNPDPALSSTMVYVLK